MVFPRAGLLALAFLASRALANTAISDSDMNDLLNQGGVDLAMKAAPIWYFGQARNHPPCYPTLAFQNGQQTPSGDPCAWPNAGCNCRTPGVAISNKGPDFPIYYTYQKCSDSEIRIAYHLFFEKDGFLPRKDGSVYDSGGNGHGYDWERSIIIWNKDSNSNWVRGTLKMSTHSGYHVKSWNDIQNTVPEGQWDTVGFGGPQALRGEDHPKVYVGWGKHAIFDTRQTHYDDIASTTNDNEFRSQDWWYYVPSGSYIRADTSTTEGQQIANANWGDAASTPPKVHESLCSA